MIYLMYNLHMKYAIIPLAYLLGSVPWALVIGKVFYNTDIRESGSGNLGGTNAGRVLGKKAGVIVMTLDILKAVLAVYLGSLFSEQIGALAGIFCTIGHCYPLFAGFRGGKAVSTSAGFLVSIVVFLKLNYLILLIPVLVFFIILYLFKMVSLASITAAFTAMITSLFLPLDWVIKATIVVLAVLIVFRHHSNIKRIMNGSESKIKWM